MSIQIDSTDNKQMPELTTDTDITNTSKSLEHSDSTLQTDQKRTRQNKRPKRQITHDDEGTSGYLRGSEAIELMNVFIGDDEDRRKRRGKKRRKRQQQQQQQQQQKPPSNDNDNKSNDSTTEKPRWYNQMYVMFLALRSSPDYTASRSELVRKAVELDKKISNERGLARVFTGKTPMNSASALLTNNGDKYFIQFRPPGAKCFYFKLAYKPGDFESALGNYNEWMDLLINHDWPICFGPPAPKLEKEEKQEGLENNVVEPNKDVGPTTTTTTITATTPAAAAVTTLIAADNNKDDLPNINSTKEHTDTNQAPTEYEIPKRWQDIVRVGPSTIPNAGNGLFATRDLPAHCPLGFYFGVPMTEDEFDSLKDHLGLASHYSIMYRRTVLDASDENGQPYTDPNGRLYCPFHFMNEDRDGKTQNIAFIEGAKVNQIICTSTRKIKQGEELFVFYGNEVDREHWGNSRDTKVEPPKLTSLDINNDNNSIQP